MAYRTPKPMVRVPPWQAFQGQRPQPGHEEWGQPAAVAALARSLRLGKEGGARKEFPSGQWEGLEAEGKG